MCIISKAMVQCSLLLFSLFFFFFFFFCYIGLSCELRNTVIMVVIVIFIKRMSLMLRHWRFENFVHFQPRLCVDTQILVLLFSFDSFFIFRFTETCLLTWCSMLRNVWFYFDEIVKDRMKEWENYENKPKTTREANKKNIKQPSKKSNLRQPWSMISGRRKKKWK